MCLGAILWSGVPRVVYAAHREDAEAIGFDEGPVLPGAAEHLGRRGIVLEAGPLREEAAAVLRLYAERGGPIYNGS
jgi:tRNA(Arg) A34 adenosine deaminase TadA